MVGQLSPTQVRRLGGIMKRCRENSGHTQSALAHHLTMSKSMLSRFEAGQGWPRTHDLVEGIERALTFIGITGESFDKVMELARQASFHNWLDVSDGHKRSQHLDTLTSYEAEATRIDSINPLVVPGLLQTREYAELVIAAISPTTTELAERVTRRMARQGVLSRLALSVVLGSPVLGDHLDARSVMAGQVAHLLLVAKKPGITIRVLPGPQMKLMANGAYAVLHFHDQPAVAQADTPFGGMFVDQPEGVARAMRHTSILLDAALSPEDSVVYMENALSALQQEKL